MQLDAIYRHGRFTTLDDSRPEAHTVGVLGGRVVGLDEEVDGLRCLRTVRAGVRIHDDGTLPPGGEGMPTGTTASTGAADRTGR